MTDLVLITGTSSGIGLSAAVECAALGMRVVATMRDVDRRGPLEDAAAARGVSVSVEELDVTSPGAGDRVRALALKYGPFYGLVNNAGIAVAGPFEELSDRDIRDQFETNVFGLMAVTRAVLPSMRAAGRGRIINVSSVSGRIALPVVGMYAATKHAVEGFSEALRYELEPFGIDVCVVEPGTYRTPIFAGNRRLAEHLDREGPYAALIRAVEAIVERDMERAPPPDEVGTTIARLLHGRGRRAWAPSWLPALAGPPLRTVVGREARASIALRRFMPDRLFSTGVRRALRGPRPR